MAFWLTRASTVLYKRGSGESETSNLETYVRLVHLWEWAHMVQNEGWEPLWKVNSPAMKLPKSNKSWIWVLIEWHISLWWSTNWESRKGCRKRESGGRVPDDKEKKENFCLAKNNSNPGIITARYHGGPVLHPESHGSSIGVDCKFCSRNSHTLASSSTKR